MQCSWCNFWLDFNRSHVLVFDLRYDGLAKMFNVSERRQFDKRIIQRIQEHPRLSDSSSQLLTEARIKMTVGKLTRHLEFKLAKTHLANSTSKPLVMIITFISKLVAIVSSLFQPSRLKDRTNKQTISKQNTKTSFWLLNWALNIFEFHIVSYSSVILWWSNLNYIALPIAFWEIRAWIVQLSSPTLVMHQLSNKCNQTRPSLSIFLIQNRIAEIWWDLTHHTTHLDLQFGENDGSGDPVACRAFVLSTGIVVLRTGAFLWFSHIFVNFSQVSQIVSFSFLAWISARHN